ncbi:hypothetical protein EPI10_006282 [Gossypium australe]|uniref:Uncharacterized protein n=1 Tax=Gossypium australe TaxID=47621 RepID=A0A5B6WQL5_9ROSI|nr:hypothetical protein EPI10_006282 [Gossypium australe]
MLFRLINALLLYGFDEPDDIQVDPSKISIIVNWKAPKNVQRKEYVVYSDASLRGLAYASRQLKPHKRTYLTQSRIGRDCIHLEDLGTLSVPREMSCLYQLSKPEIFNDSKKN